jgi:hypothetical protein
MEGEANQKDITGARGTPPMSSAATTGITEQEHKGLKAPTKVARIIAMTGRAVKARVMYLEAPDIFTATAMGMVMSKYGQVCRKLSIMYCATARMWSIMFTSFIVKKRYTKPKKISSG